MLSSTAGIQVREPRDSGNQSFLSHSFVRFPAVRNGQRLSEQSLTVSYLAALAFTNRSTLLLGSAEGWAVSVLEVLHHLAVPLPLLLRVVL